MTEETKLPSTLGTVSFDADQTRLWGSDASKFDVRAHSTLEAPPEPAKPPQTNVLPMPMALLPSTSFIPKEYRVHLHSQRCLHCSTVHEWSEVFAFNSIATRLGQGKPIMNLVPVDRFSYNVPILTLRMPPRTVPACHECAGGSLNLSHLPRPADTAEYQKVIAAYQTPGNISTPETRKEPLVAKSITGAKAPKKPFTIDDL